LFSPESIVFLSSPFVHRAVLLAVAFLGLAVPAHAAKFKAVRGYTSDQMQQWTNELEKTNFFPVSICGYDVGGEARFAAVAIDDGTERGWEIQWNLSGAEFDQKQEKLKQEGHHPICIVGYPNGDETSYAGIWIHDGKNPRWHTLRHYDLDNLYRRIEELKEKGLRPTYLTGYTAGSTQRFAAIFHTARGEEWTSRYNMTGAQFQKAFDELKGYRPISITGYQRDGATRFGCIFVKDGKKVPWVSRYGLTADGLRAEFEKHTPKGYRPLCISGYQAGSELRYAAIWVKGE
jgi:hypothetical protein